MKKYKKRMRRAARREQKSTNSYSFQIVNPEIDEDGIIITKDEMEEIMKDHEYLDVIELLKINTNINAMLENHSNAKKYADLEFQKLIKEINTMPDMFKQMEKERKQVSERMRREKWDKDHPILAKLLKGENVTLDILAAIFG